MASMGFAAHAAKTNENNLSMLRKPSYFREIASRNTSIRRSRIDGTNLKRKTIIIARRKLNQRLTFSIVMAFIVFLFVLLYTLLL